MADDYRTEFEKMQDQWDAAVRDGVFKDSSKPPLPSPDDPTPLKDYGMSREMASVAGASERMSDADYWTAVFRASNGERVAEPGPGVLSEGSGGRSPNPIPLWTRGVDAENRVARWCDLDDLNKLIEMKKDLHALGDKVAALRGGEGVAKKIKGLQKQIDEISDSLGQPPEEQRAGGI